MTSTPLTDPFARFDLVRIVVAAGDEERRGAWMEALPDASLEQGGRIAFVETEAPAGAGSWRQFDENARFLVHLRILEEGAGGAGVLIVEQAGSAVPPLPMQAPAGCDIWLDAVEAGDDQDGGTTRFSGFSRAAVARLVPFLEALLHQDSAPPEIDAAYALFRNDHPELTAVASAAPPVPDEISRDRGDEADPDGDRWFLGPRGGPPLTFGVREAAILSAIGCAVASFVAWRDLAG